LHHPHVHCVVPAGGLSPDGTRWVHARPSFLLPVKVLSRVFRGKVVAGLIEVFRAGTLKLPTDLHRLTDESAFRAWLLTLYRHDWIVYDRP
jgi:putative transposase